MKDAIYPMRAVVRQTGLTAHVIRAWERRYAAVVPHRTSSGRRLYSMADIERLKLLKKGVGVGNSIAQIAKMDTETLRALIPATPPVPQRQVKTAQTRVLSPQVYVDKAMKAVLQLDAAAMERTLDRAVVALPRPVLMNQMILPLLNKIGTWWADGRLKVINEHLASVVLRHFLGEALRSVEVEPSAPVIVTATPSGQWHEFGAMIAAVLAMEIGWQAVYCGANLPAEEVAAAAQEKHALAVALSVVQPSDIHKMTKEIRRLVRLLPSGCRLLVGGRFADALTDQFETASLIFVSDMSAFQRVLQTSAKP